MTRAELIELVRPLKWRKNYYGRSSSAIRCEQGNCPIIAAYYLKFPDGANFGNFDWAEAAMALNIDLGVARQIALDADYDNIPELVS
jgi:hypothetical protein